MEAQAGVRRLTVWGGGRLVQHDGSQSPSWARRAPTGQWEGRACQTTTAGRVILGKQGENGNGVWEEGAVCLIRAQDQ